MLQESSADDKKIDNLITNLEIIIKEHFIGHVEVLKDLIKLRLLNGDEYEILVKLNSET